MTIIAQIVPRHQVAQYSNAVGGIYSLGAVAGPLIGGAFTSKVTWRWCFYIVGGNPHTQIDEKAQCSCLTQNLPIGGITLFACAFLLKSELDEMVRISTRI